MLDTQQFAACLAYSSAQKMEALHSSKILVNFYQITWYHIPQGGTLYSYYCDKHKQMYSNNTKMGKLQVWGLW
jgi:hypothetical protein